MSATLNTPIRLSGKLVRRSWLCRVVAVSTPGGHFLVEYNGRGLGFERVIVRRASQVFTLTKVSPRWFIPRFEFAVGDLPAVVEVRVWPWLTLRTLLLYVGGERVYCE